MNAYDHIFPLPFAHVDIMRIDLFCDLFPFGTTFKFVCFFELAGNVIVIRWCVCEVIVHLFFVKSF